MAGWLQPVGVEPYRDAPLVAPGLARIDPALVQCVYGEDEADTLYTAPVMARSQRIRTDGSHHFDGGYDALARRIPDGLRRRASPAYAKRAS